jgi:nucleoside-diphosphate-sugar epimerase
MKILVTGNMGYVGPVLTRFLKKTIPSINIYGYDEGFFGHSLTGVDNLPETLLEKQFYGDVRSFDPSILEGMDAVVHLAAVSNDPMGKEFEKVTYDINREASVNIAKMAANAGVKNFVFASSCSMYGQAEGGPRKETDPTNPLTAYAQSKIGTELDAENSDFGSMIFTSLRFATACGMSDRLRLDLVLNDFVACAISSGEITVLSDGSPWRPLIDVEDMARAILWAITRDASNGGKFLAVNAGRDENNYQVKDLAAAVAKHIPGTTVNINLDAPPDKRSYKVDFSLFKSLASNFLPQVDLDTSILRLKDGFERMSFNDKNFRESPYMRLNTLRRHIKNNILDSNLNWKA